MRTAHTDEKVCPSSTEWQNPSSAEPLPAEETEKILEEHARLQNELASLREERIRLQKDLERLRRELDRHAKAPPKSTLLLHDLHFSDYEIIGESPALRNMLKQVEIVAPTNATVLIEGETGTGKELVARAVHSLSKRRDHPLAKINCAAIPSSLLESELFGYEKGAFTGAIARKVGRFELAHQGTLFLDEIGDMPLDIQPKLLRVIQEQEFERVGGVQSQKINVRLVAATSRDLCQMVAERLFRDDLFYRINVFPIRIPPLRERAEDIPLLTRHFVNAYALQMNKKIDVIPEETLDFLCSYPWPGNVRQLQNFIERAVIMSPGHTLEAPLTELRRNRPMPADSEAAEASRPSTLEEREREHILRALNETRWVVGGPHGAAALLGVRRTTLIWKMQKLGISRKTPQPSPLGA